MVGKKIRCFLVVTAATSALVAAFGTGAQQASTAGPADGQNDTLKPTMDANGTVHLPEVRIPLSIYLSEPARQSVIKDFADSQNPRSYGIDPKTASIAEIREAVNRTLTPMLERTKTNYPVRIEPRQIAGVSTLMVDPLQGVAGRNRSRVLINVHGGGFEVGGGGVHGLLESIPIASVGQIKVVTVDYRMGPENTFPAASEDVAAVYRALLKDHAAKNIGIYGCSAGGVLAAQSAAWIHHQGLPTPGAIGIFSASAFADFTGNPQTPGSWGGDSRYVTAPLQGEDPLPVLGSSASAPTQVPYLTHVNLADPMVSPALAPDVLAKFPPTLLVTGTRAYDMSAAVQTQRNLRKAGVEADLELWDGLGHCFFLNSDLPESKEMYDVVTRFFDQHLGR